ncbi:MAG: hypothetical protein WAU68_12270 [Vitreimonas sp.]
MCVVFNDGKHVVDKLMEVSLICDCLTELVSQKTRDQRFSDLDLGQSVGGCKPFDALERRRARFLAFASAWLGAFATLLLSSLQMVSEQKQHLIGVGDASHGVNWGVGVA